MVVDRYLKIEKLRYLRNYAAKTNEILDKMHSG